MSSDRSNTVTDDRGELDRLRDELRKAQEKARRDEVEHERLVVQMREVNEHLVMAMVRSEELADEANAARQAIASSELACQAKDEFLAMLGHELRNPLAPILTALQLMQLRGDTGRELAIIDRQVTHMVRLVDDLLDVSRITRGKIELTRQRVEIAEVVAAAIETAHPLIEQRQHELVIRVPRHGCEVDGDPGRLAQVVSNLLTNAAKYTEPSGTIAIVATCAGDRVSLRISDTGIGIAPEVAAKIFDRFVQEPQAIDRAQGGLGLGLTIVRSLVELHGGRVAVHSEGRGKGAEFRVDLPAARRPRVVAERRAVPSLKRGADGHGPVILVVDDNEDAAEMLALLLENLGCETCIAHDGPTALRIAEMTRPSLALLDIGLPAMDGYELAQRLRAKPGLERIRIVAVTGYGQDKDRDRSSSACFDDHLVKPVDIHQLVEVVDVPDDLA